MGDRNRHSLEDDEETYEHDEGTSIRGDLRRICRWVLYPLIVRLRRSRPPILPPRFQKRWKEHSQDPQEIFFQGMHGYRSFRIPALIHHNGLFFAFCEARMTAYGDSGDRMDIVLRIGRPSEGKGVEWDPMQIVAYVPEYRSMNAVPIVDQTTGDIIVVFTVFPITPTEADLIGGTSMRQKVLLTRSKDNGISWSRPLDITAQTLEKIEGNPLLYSSGPGHGIQLTSGRLIVPGNVHKAKETPESRWTRFLRKLDGMYERENLSIIFYSDDHGKTWKVGGEIPPVEHDGTPVRANECQAAELEDNHVYVNSRTQLPAANRQESHSDDEGLSFSRLEQSKHLHEPGYFLSKRFPTLVQRGGCQGSVVSFEPPAKLKKTSDAKRWVVFSNPANGYVRSNMSLRLSRDGGKSWSSSFPINPHPSAYSDLTFYKTAHQVENTGQKVSADGTEDTVANEDEDSDESGILVQETNENTKKEQPVNRKKTLTLEESVKIACLYECGSLHPYERIAFQEINLDELIQHS